MSRRHFTWPLMFILCLLATFLVPLTSPQHALASTNPITITSQSTADSFPDSLTFNATASDPSSNIVSASIMVNLGSYSGPENHDLTISSPGHTLSLQWKENTTGNNFVPPGTIVYYFWHFTDASGNGYFQPQQQLVTIDTRFNWQHLNQGLLQVNWYNRSLDFGHGVLSQASSSISRISATLGGGLKQPINLWVYETDSDFHGSLSPNSYEWVGGIAFPSLEEASIVAQGLDDTTLSRDMPHELTHLIFHQLIDGGGYAPTWFDEGLAVYNQLYHEPEMMARFQQALATHSLLRLGSISFGFPANADQAFLAYAQSWNLVQYMYETFGQPKMAQFIKNIGNPSYDFGQAMQAALGVDIPHLENQWRLHLNQSGTLTPDQMTPTPQVTPRPTSTTHPVTTNGNDYSWPLIVLGSVLVIGSLVGLLAIFVVGRRTRRAPAYQRQVNPAWDSRQALSHSYGRPLSPTPPTYPSPTMPLSHVANEEHPMPWPLESLDSPELPPISRTPAGQNQEYSSTPPRKQAPQE
jgi:hypothetical protein